SRMVRKPVTRTRTRFLTLAAFAAAGAAVGCATSSSYPLPAYPAQPAAYTQNELLPAPAADGRPSVVTLPEAVHECLFANLRIRVKSEKTQQAMADLTTEGIIPNLQLLADYQLIP